MSLELIAKFDPFLADHIVRFGNKGSGSTSYLSHVICDDFILLMMKKLKHNIVKELKISKYFSISIDSTPDISHGDKLSFMVRYVLETGLPVERFLCFVSNPGHKALDLINAITNTLKSHDIDISDCRGQSYDSASNMSGQYSGVQARIKEINPLVYYVPCNAHSLNLVGISSAESCSQASMFFGFIQQLYNFFSASTHRWSILQLNIKHNANTIKSLTNIRWSARADACRALYNSWDESINAMVTIKDDIFEK